MPESVQPVTERLRVVLIGCVESSEAALTLLLSHQHASVVGVVTRAKSDFNSDFRSLEPLALKSGVPCFLARGKDDGPLAAWVQGLSPDVVYCFGWSFLLGPAILSIPRLGVIGCHPAALPRNRGRHPLIWALALGLERTASTFFFMDEGADTGDILSQEPIAIGPDDDARALYDKVSRAELRQIQDFTTHLALGTHRRIAQDHSIANNWRKRTAADGRIDWRMPARGIFNLVRALSKPYPGATCIKDGKEVRIWRTKVLADEAGEFANIEPGKVLDSDSRTFTVKCGTGTLRVLDHEFDELPERGSYL